MGGWDRVEDERREGEMRGGRKRGGREGGMICIEEMDEKRKEWEEE